MCRVTEPCCFCALDAGDAPNVKVAENDSTYAFLDLSSAWDHVLVIPKQPSKDLLEVGPGSRLAAHL